MHKSDLFRDSLLTGIKLDHPNVLMEWGKPIREIIKISQPKLREWSRWESDASSKTIKVQRVEALWDNIKITSLPSIQRALLSLVEIPGCPAPLFTSIVMFFSDEAMSSEVFEERRARGLRELEMVLGTSFVQQVTFQDKGGTVTYPIDVWSMHETLDVSFHPAAGLSIRKRIS